VKFRVVNLRRVEGLLLQVCAESKGDSTLEVLKVAARSASKRLLSENLKPWEKLRRYRTFE
jgi:hypothetical protein